MKNKNIKVNRKLKIITFAINNGNSWLILNDYIYWSIISKLNYHLSHHNVFWTEHHNSINIQKKLLYCPLPFSPM